LGIGGFAPREMGVCRACSATTLPSMCPSSRADQSGLTPSSERRPAPLAHSCGHRPLLLASLLPPLSLDRPPQIDANSTGNLPHRPPELLAGMPDLGRPPPLFLVVARTAAGGNTPRQRRCTRATKRRSCSRPRMLGREASHRQPVERRGGSCDWSI
jgi:hypothetical protein